MSYGEALETALAAARAAADILRRDLESPEGPRGGRDKADADLEAELAIRARLLDAFPEWFYLGEETGRQEGKPGAPAWLVDPNDGTHDYLAGRRGSAVSIGLVVAGRPVLGVVLPFAYPDGRGETFAWVEGKAAVLRNGREVRAQLPSELTATDVVLLSSKGDRDPEAHLLRLAPARYRTVPSIAHRLALVASGEAAATASLHDTSAWDYAAGQALLRAAGGVLLNEDGREVSYTADGTSRSRRAFAGAPRVAAALAGQPWSAPASGEGESGILARLRRGEAILDSALLSRAQGCLLGQVGGDSLGSLVEFSTASHVELRYPGGPNRLEDGGAWNTLAGQATDDSEMAFCLSRAILRDGLFAPGVVLDAYRRWLASRPFDVGNTVRAALAGSPRLDSQANGSLMRIAPLAIFAHALPPARAAALALEDAALTHPHPVCGASAAAFVMAVRHALVHGDGPRPAHEAALGWAREAGAPPAVRAALEDARAAPPVCDGDCSGFVLIALQNAFFELLHAPSLEAGVVATVRRGGDTDTNAAIAGALLGAVYGREAVPAQWRSMVLSCRPHPLRARQPRPMAYWPVDVYEQAEGLLWAGAAHAARLG